MEGFQAKENTFVEREAKESPFEIRQKYAKLTAEDWNIFFYLQMSVLNIFSSSVIQKTISYGAGRNVMFLQLSK